VQPADLNSSPHRAPGSFRLGAARDAINALLVAAGHNLRLILNWLRLFVAWLIAALMGSSAQSDTSQEPWNPIAA